MRAWMGDNGCDTSKVNTIFYTPEERGVQAACYINSGDTILLVPKPLLICGQILGKEPMCGKIFSLGLSKRLKKFEQSLFSVYLLQFKRGAYKDSFHSPYINILPREFYNFPCFFNEEELSYLEETEAVQ